MKRIFLLVVIGLLLVGCGLNNAAQDNLSNAVSLGWDEGVAAIILDNEVLENGAGKVWTDMRPLAGTNVALVTYRVEMEKDALKLGGNGPFYLYGGGLLQVQDDKAVFLEVDPFSAEGQVQMRGFQATSGGDAAIVDWLMEPKNLAGFGSFGTEGLIPAAAIKLGDDSSTGQIIMASVATAGGGMETAVANAYDLNPNDLSLIDFQCEGHMIPGSNQASLSYIAKTDDDRVLIGAGIGLLNDMPAAKSDTAFTCHLEGKGGIAFRSNVDGVKGAQIVDLAIEGLKVVTENGRSSSIDMATVYGFNIGMPPGFNIGMPPSYVGGLPSNFNIGMPPK